MCRTQRKNPRRVDLLLTWCLRLRSRPVDQSGVVDFKTGHRTEAGLSWTRLAVIQRLPPRCPTLLLTVLAFRVLSLLWVRQVHSLRLLRLFFGFPHWLLLLILHLWPLLLLLLFLLSLPLVLWADLAVRVGLPPGQEMAPGQARWHAFTQLGFSLRFWGRLRRRGCFRGRLVR